MAKTQRIQLNLITVMMLIITVLSALLFFTIRHDLYTQSQMQTQTTSAEDLANAKSQFLQDEEMVVIIPEPDATSSEPLILPVERVLFEYVEVVDGCGPHFEGECLNVRSGPGTEYPVVSQLRNGMVLKIDGQVERDGQAWYKVVFDEWLRYPNRLKGDWYVAADYVKVLLDEGVKTVWKDGSPTTSKKQIIVDRSEQMLYAYEDDNLFIELKISTGLALTPTPRGTFTIFKKTPSRYMQGPLPGLADQQVYDLPGVPWNLYFTEGGAVIHGAYWHNSFGTAYSHGCVNVPTDKARLIYNWADLGTKVVVRD